MGGGWLHFRDYLGHKGETIRGREITSKKSNKADTEYPLGDLSEVGKRGTHVVHLTKAGGKGVNVLP